MAKGTGVKNINTGRSRHQFRPRLHPPLTPSPPNTGAPLAGRDAAQSAGCWCSMYPGLTYVNQRAGSAPSTTTNATRRRLSTRLSAISMLTRRTSLAPRALLPLQRLPWTVWSASRLRCCHRTRPSPRVCSCRCVCEPLRDVPHRMMCCLAPQGCEPARRTRTGSFNRALWRPHGHTPRARVNLHFWMTNGNTAPTSANSLLHVKHRSGDPFTTR
jgi:hypothetical protein